MPFRPVPTLAIPLLVVLGACGTSGILRVDQDRYNTNLLQQGASIIGPPANDTFGLIIDSAISDSDFSPDDLGRAVRIGDRAEFRTVESHSVPDRYQIVWTGARPSITDAVNNIIFRDDDQNEALRIRYSLNRVEPIWGEDAGLAPTQLNQELPHEVRVILHMSGNPRADVRITTRDEVVLLERINLEFINDDFSRLDVVEVRSQTDYFMRDLIAISLNN